MQTIFLIIKTKANDVSKNIKLDKCMLFFLDLDDMMESATPSPNTSSAHIRVPCFSMYELRHKHFSKMTNNAVYAYTYKHQIKSLKTPSHWVREGGCGEEGGREREEREGE